jgi:hypothetical protein
MAAEEDLPAVLDEGPDTEASEEASKEAAEEATEEEAAAEDESTAAVPQTRVRVLLRLRPLLRREYGYPLAADKQGSRGRVAAPCSRQGSLLTRTFAPGCASTAPRRSWSRARTRCWTRRRRRRRRAACCSALTRALEIELCAHTPRPGVLARRRCRRRRVGWTRRNDTRLWPDRHALTRLFTLLLLLSRLLAARPAPCLTHTGR